MIASLQPKSNVAHKVRNTKLPKPKALMPLFEVISNSIHAIDEARKENILKEPGKIDIKVIRNGDQLTLESMENVDVSPVNSFEVIDNGIGLNDRNLEYFVEADTDHKMEIGGKGVGRFVCLKAFQKMIVDSNSLADGVMIKRHFEFHPSKEDTFRNYEETSSNAQNTGTKITLSVYRDEYQKYVPRPITLLADAIVEHFQLYFIKGSAPIMKIENQNNDYIDLQAHFHKEYKGQVLSKDFEVAEFSFTLHLTKSYKGQSHKIHFCAHNRSVKEEGLASRIVDLGKHAISDENGQFYYQAFVVGQLLDDNVETERVGFTISTEEEEEGEEDPSEVSLYKIRRGAISTIEDLLADYLGKVREEKMSSYKPTIYNEYPQYRTVFEHRKEEVKKLPPNLSKQKLDVEFYKIEANWKTEVKEEAKKLLDDSKDIQNLPAYKERYEKFLEDFNEIGKADLARYVVHRKAVIDLLEKLLGKNEEDKFTDEEVIHSIFFPIRSSSDEVSADKQNLWLLDERLTYHSFLASDKRFEQISDVDSASKDRPDLLIFNDALAFTEDPNPPFNSFTIVEFKKPQRKGYTDYDQKKNPLDQVESYIEELLKGNVTSRQGRTIKVDRNVPFYVYIVCDIDDSFEAILRKREFKRTPDGMGYFSTKSEYYSAYIEVLPFDKVLADAKKRNRILFDQLGIS
jgi:hypothetical protein